MAAEAAKKQHAGHEHGHDAVLTATGQNRNRLKIVLGMYLTIIVAEIIGAWLTGSLALLAESMHMAIDGSGILIALVAAFLATRKPSATHTFGLFRAEVVAVLANCLLLFGLGVFIFLEAVDRWRNPGQVAGAGVIVFAVVSLCCSVASMIVLNAGAKESLNVKAAFLEVMSDGIGAAAIIVSGILNVTVGWRQGDVVAAVVIGVIILPRAFALLRQAVNIIMQGVPEGMDVEQIRAEIERIAGVGSVHSLHVWSLTSGVPVLSAHVVAEPQTWRDGSAPTMLDQLTGRMRAGFNIEHCTFQIEEHGHQDHEGRLNREG
jgi:cobalt-zinc-cadmium efflux system protein